MKPYYQDNDVTLYNGDCRYRPEIPDESIQCVVTSPPNWGIRVYAGVPDLIWGGESGCQHDWIAAGARLGHPDRSTGDHDSKGSGIFVDRIPRGAQAAKASRGAPMEFGKLCSVCDAWKGSYGLEPTPAMYVRHTIEILREVWRVLRKDGVVFWNIRDSMVTSPKGSLKGQDKSGLTSTKTQEHSPVGIDKRWSGPKPINLCLIPQRVAIAAQEDGWHVVSEIIWEKPNPMPESVKRRPTRAHEQIWMLTKNAKYYWDQEAVREPQSPNTHARGTEAGGRASKRGPKSDTRGDGGIAGWLQLEADQWTQRGRNIRSVWHFPTQPYRGPHYATFPERLPETCIKAATPEVGCCSRCGTPWERIVEKTTRFEGGSGKAGRTAEEVNASGKWAGQQYGQNIKLGPVVDTETTGWQPRCDCDAEKVPSLVLDPFAGTGTTLAVAKALGRRSVGIELSQDYCDLAIKRIPI